MEPHLTEQRKAGWKKKGSQLVRSITHSAKRRAIMDLWVRLQSYKFESRGRGRGERDCLSLQCDVGRQINWRKEVEEDGARRWRTVGVA